MYFPFLRGRQYDLLAIRELETKNLLNDNIIPIIEPIKLTSTLLKTVNAFEENNKNVILITNPKVGSFLGELSNSSIYHKYIEMCKSKSVILGHYFNENSEREIGSLLEEFEVKKKDIALIHCDRNIVSNYKEIFNEKPRFNIIPSKVEFRRKLNRENLVALEDKYNKLPRNSDYLECEKEFFSEEHKYFKDEGYLGFSDYSIVGSEYSESGFAPYAVAIHIVAPNEDDALEIHHFVSDSNDDISDPAGKFSEALEKMMYWYGSVSDDERLNTYAMSTFKEHYENGTYPGLPTLKKLNIMHHIELVSRLLEDKEITDELLY